MSVCVHLRAGVSLPSGAVVTRIVLDACITGSGIVHSTLSRIPDQEGAPDPLPVPLASVATSEFDVVTAAGSARRAFCSVLRGRCLDEEVGGDLDYADQVTLSKALEGAP
jgi:hypothetical protein